MRFKKITAVFAAAAMCFSMLTACGSENAADGTAAADTSVSAAADVAESGSARVTVDGTKFMVNGKELWINGVNTPWQNWNDFNGKMDEAQWDETFKQLKADGVNCTRIWVNCNGMSTVRLKSTGEIKEVNESHWTDLEKLFAIAEKYQVYVMPTILSFDHFKDTNSGGTQWQTLITTKEFADGFVEQYAAEFAKRFKDCEYIFAVDLMNEPDWVHENDECGKISWENLSYLFAKCAQAIHENSDMLVTVGTGMIKYNSDQYDGNYVSDEYLKSLSGSDESYLDFYSPHYYIWERQWYGFPFDKSPTEFGLDGTKPAIIAETSNDDEAESGMSCKDKYESCYNNGWNGVMAWMEYRSDGSSGCDSMWYRYDLTQEATHRIYELIPEKIFPNESDK